MVTSGGEDVPLQQHVTRLLLDALGGTGFALAGSGAIREHGLTERPTHDVDLFSDPAIGAKGFRAALGAADQALQDARFGVIRLRETDTFARLRVHDESGRLLDVDLAVDWRADPPVRTSVGPVLSERDAVAGKLSAVYSRGEVRDFLDLDAIRSSGRYTDTDLLVLGLEHDPGFDRAMFAAQLSRVVRFDAEEVEEYGVTPGQFAAVQQRIYAWARELRDPPRQTSDSAVPGRRAGPEQDQPVPRTGQRQPTRRVGPWENPFGSPDGHRRSGPDPPGRTL